MPARPFLLLPLLRLACADGPRGVCGPVADITLESALASAVPGMYRAQRASLKKRRANHQAAPGLNACALEAAVQVRAGSTSSQGPPLYATAPQTQTGERGNSITVVYTSLARTLGSTRPGEVMRLPEPISRVNRLAGPSSGGTPVVQ